MRLTLPMGLYITRPTAAEESSPAVITYAVWTFSIVEPIEVAVTFTTVDESPIVIAWGDGATTEATSGVEAVHNYSAGENLILRVSNASNIIAIDIAGNAPGGVLIPGSCTQLLGIDADGTPLDSIDVGEWPATVVEVSINACNLDAGTIDLLLEALNNSNVEDGSLNYGLNPGSADESRSPEGAMAKAALAGKGWLIVS